jgi:hypothetical protein
METSSKYYVVSDALFGILARNTAIVIGFLKNVDFIVKK